MTLSALFFPHLSKPVLFKDCPCLFQETQRFFSVWNFTSQQVHSNDYANQCILIQSKQQNEKNGYEISAPWIQDIDNEPDITCTLCNLGIELVMQYSTEHKDILCLHAGAIQIAQKNILLLGDNKSGKSTLIAELLGHGAINYGDDLIGLAQNTQIFSFGIPPRLRLPLVHSLKLQNYAKKFSGVHNPHYLYLYPPQTQTVPPLKKATLSAIIILNREQGTKAALYPEVQHSGFTEILRHYVMQRGSAENVFNQAAALINAVPVYNFNYWNLSEAGQYLINYFSNSENIFSKNISAFLQNKKIQNLSLKNSANFSNSMNKSVQQIKKTKKINPDQDFIRIATVEYHSEYEKHFLIEKISDTILEINPLANIIWHLLKDPLSITETVMLLTEIFPHTKKSDIMKDTQNVFHYLLRQGFIQKVSDFSKK